MICAALLSGCQSVPTPGVALPPTSSLLAVDVLFPVPLSRDPSLVQAILMREPIPDGLDELPELIPASFVKGSRAYWLDPEPGTYSVVAVTAEYAPPWNERPVAGVTQTTWSGTSSDAIIFPAELIHRTATTVARGEVAFMGALNIRPGDHINAHAVPADALQKRIAERLRPGVTSESGLEGWLKRTRSLDLENTSLSNEPADREAFFAAALGDLGDSPWAGVVARAAPPRESVIARPRTPAPRFKSPAQSAAKNDAKGAAQKPPSIPAAVEAKPQPTVAAPQAAAAGVESSAAQAPAGNHEPEPLPLAPKRQRFPGIPPDSPLARIELGMRHDEVLEILGSPDRKIDRVTAKAWIPFYKGPDADLRDWIYAGRGRVVFSLYEGALEVIDVIYDPNQGK